MAENDTADTPQASDLPPAHKPDQRNHPRHNVRWHADILLDGHGACEGYAREISADGLTLYLDVNPEREHIKSIVLRIHVPPLDDKHPQHVVEVTGKIVYISHDAEEHMFRAGIHFTHFERDSDKAFLTARQEE